MWRCEAGPAFLPVIEVVGGKADSSVLQNVTCLVGDPQGPRWLCVGRGSHRELGASPTGPMAHEGSLFIQKIRDSQSDS